MTGGRVAIQQCGVAKKRPNNPEMPFISPIREKPCIKYRKNTVLNTGKTPY
jgi:hypothetical protein